MQAMLASDWGDPHDMRLTELPDPQPGPHQVAIAVRASACNFFDILMVQGKYQVRTGQAAPGGVVHLPPARRRQGAGRDRLAAKRRQGAGHPLTARGHPSSLRVWVLRVTCAIR